MSTTRLALCLTAAAAFAVLAACDELGNIGNTCESTGGVPIDATDGNAWIPDTLQVTPNQRVCWQNQGAATHSITTFPEQPDTIDQILVPDFTYTRSWPNVRDIAYFCRFHFEEGIIRVR